MKNLIITAHPDDSFIWAHNVRSHFPNCEWTDCVATYSEHSVRGAEFKEACKVMSSEPQFLGLTDDPEWPLGHTFRSPVGTFKDVFKSILSNGYDNVFTHSPAGEYGHRHHKDLFKKVLDTFFHPDIQGKMNLWVFSLNFGVPDVVLYDTRKRASKCLEIYERERYIIDNFDMIGEGYCLLQSGETDSAKAFVREMKSHHMKDTQYYE